MEWLVPRGFPQTNHPLFAILTAVLRGKNRPRLAFAGIRFGPPQSPKACPRMLAKCRGGRDTGMALAESSLFLFAETAAMNLQRAILLSLMLWLPCGVLEASTLVIRDSIGRGLV